ncbi:MAG: NUDIX hydrolase [Chloroflexi bacterium]|nr:NUDIX hydrolase [Chloroflexota bacterium]
MQTPDPATVETLSTETVFSGRAFSVRVSRIRKGDGTVTTREVVEHPEVVAIVALDKEDNALLVRQHRFAVGKELLEIPAGGVEPGETPDECVRRELREETGYLPHNLKRLGGFHSAPGFCSEYLHLYLATELERSPLHASDTDEIRVERIPINKTRDLILSGEIEDAKSIAGLLTVLTFGH